MIYISYITQTNCIFRHCIYVHLANINNLFELMLIRTKSFLEIYLKHDSKETKSRAFQARKGSR